MGTLYFWLKEEYIWNVMCGSRATNHSLHCGVCVYDGGGALYFGGAASCLIDVVSIREYEPAARKRYVAPLPDVRTQR